jgi:hypothetical protein
MPYVFAFLVIANAGYLAYQLLQEKDPTLLQPVAMATHKDFPVTLVIVPEHGLFQHHTTAPVAPSGS